MENFSSADQDFRLWVLLEQVTRALRKAREKELNEYGISAADAAVFSIIQATDKQATPAEISPWLLREPHSVSGLLSRMEKEGLVRRVKDWDKKNLVRIAMTERDRRPVVSQPKESPSTR